LSSSGTTLLIGFGNMGQALAGGWLERGRRPETIHVVDPAPGTLAAARRLGVRAAEAVSLLEADLRPDVIVLAVKPSKLAAALADCARFAGSGPLFLSIAAGKTLASISAVLGPAAVVRAMPNTPAAVGKGTTVLTAGANVSEGQRAAAGELMAAVGRVEWVADERLMDAVTAVSGSGPAYVFLLIESLAAAGRAVGLPAGLATRLAVATVAGAGAYAEMADADAAELKRRVTSPGGTTEAALRVLEAEDGLGPLIERAVRAAAERSRELSGD
jgi:pyrroline-5-carboxylate reductase